MEVPKLYSRIHKNLTDVRLPWLQHVILEDLCFFVMKKVVTSKCLLMSVCGGSNKFGNKIQEMSELTIFCPVIGH